MAKVSSHPLICTLDTPVLASVYDLDQYLGLEWDIIDPLTRTLDWNGMCLRPRPAHTMICTLGLEWNDIIDLLTCTLDTPVLACVYDAETSTFDWNGMI